jgi:hypothetical protein
MEVILCENSLYFGYQRGIYSTAIEILFVFRSRASLRSDCPLPAGELYLLRNLPGNAE